MKKITKISILTVLLSNYLSAFSLEESLLNSNKILNKKEVVKKEYYKIDSSNYYDLKMSTLIIVNNGNKTRVVRARDNLTKKKIIDIMIEPKKTEKLQIPIGSYDINIYYNDQNKKFINFDKLFGESTLKKTLTVPIKFNKTIEYKHSCKGTFKGFLKINVTNNNNTMNDGLPIKKEDWIRGECIENQIIIINKKNITNKINIKKIDIREKSIKDKHIIN